MSATTAEQPLERVTTTPGVRSGQAIIRGTRTTVADILGWLAAGASEQEILRDYPCCKLRTLKPPWLMLRKSFAIPKPVEAPSRLQSFS
jgi:uncharacterized protein (DUF433 family)